MVSAVRLVVVGHLLVVGHPLEVEDVVHLVGSVARRRASVVRLLVSRSARFLCRRVIRMVHRRLITRHHRRGTCTRAVIIRMIRQLRSAMVVFVITHHPGRSETVLLRALVLGLGPPIVVEDRALRVAPHAGMVLLLEARAVRLLPWPVLLALAVLATANATLHHLETGATHVTCAITRVITRVILVTLVVHFLLADLAVVLRAVHPHRAVARLLVWTCIMHTVTALLPVVTCRLLVEGLGHQTADTKCNCWRLNVS